MERARDGDRDAFGVLVRAHLAGVVGVALRIVRNVADAEDVAQDAFIAALQSIDRFDTKRPFGPWVSRIAVNRALDLVDSQRVRLAEASLAGVVDPGPSPVADAERNELFAHVRRALAGMPPRQRLVVEMHDLDGTPVRDIADAIGAAPATVRWHLFTGRRTLRSALRSFHELSNE